ncbi:MAG: N-acetyl-gamma-glutamyl-phosphate reductase [Magnetococcus sp. WYHC-3]
MTTRVAILGATGYTGGELVRLLSRHPAVEITTVTSERTAGHPYAESYPHLRGALGRELVCEKMDVDAIAAKADLAFCALPHAASMTVVAQLLQRGLKVVDLSADFRLKDPAVYAQWYGLEHQNPELLGEAAYGLPEINRKAIPGARLVANPGCYPTASLLALAPLAHTRAILRDHIIIDAKSGVSGAGRTPSQGSLYAELEGGLRPYKVDAHRHVPEIEQGLVMLGAGDGPVRFTPHLIPQSRGMLATVYVRPVESRSEEQWRRLFLDYYAQEACVRVLPAGHYPSTAQVRGANLCDIAVTLDPRTGMLVVMSVIDNLVKGASGAAVQNMNLILGLEERLGLEAMPLFP